MRAKEKKKPGRAGASVVSRQKTKKHSTRSVQGLLDYEALTESGILSLGEGKYSIMLALSDINYSLAPPSVQEELVEKYAQFINSFLPGVHVQIIVLNRVLDKEDIASGVRLGLRGDGFDHFRKEYNSLITARLSTDRNNTATEKFLVLTVGAPGFNEGKAMLLNLAAEVAVLLREVGGCVASVLDGRQRAQVFSHFLRPGNKLGFEFSDLLGAKLSTKDFLAPQSMDLSSPNFLVVQAAKERCWQVLVLRKMPPWLSDRVLKELSDLPLDLCVSVHFDPIEQSEALRLVKHQISSMDIQRSNEQRKLAKQGLDTGFGSHELESSYDAAVALRDKLKSSNEKLFETTILVGVSGEDKEDLADSVARVKRACAKHSCDLEVLKFMQKDAFLSLMPFGKNSLPVTRTLTTAALAVLEPFTTQECFENNGLFYGVNGLSKNLIMLARQHGMNSNGFILGTSGSGKSQFAKFEMTQIFLRRPHDEVLIIDPEREYVGLAQALNAARVVISPGSNQALNALEVDRSLNRDEDPVRAKCSFVLSLCEVLLGGVNGLSNIQRSLLDRCAQNIYRRFFNDPGALMPTLMLLYQELQAQPEVEASALATGLEIYAKGSASGFARETNVDLSARVVVYDLADLGRDLQTFGMLVVVENIWDRIVANKAKGVRTWLYIDEFHLLFENDFAASYCQAIYKRVRKYGAAATGITQNIEELLLNDRARLMLSNSDSIFLLNQQSTDAQALQDLLRLSRQQKAFFMNARPGCGLLKSGSRIIPFDNSMDPNSTIFQIFQTTFREKPEKIGENEVVGNVG